MWLCGKGSTETYREKLMCRSNRSWHIVNDIQRLKIYRRWRTALSKGKGQLIKDNMTRDDDSIGDKIKTAVSLMMSRIAKEDAESRTGCKFMGSSGRKIGVTLTTEDPKMIVGRRTAKEGKMRGREIKGLGGQDVEEKSCSVQRLGPIRRGHARLK